jgi:hypothetical protein
MILSKYSMVLSSRSGKSACNISFKDILFLYVPATIITYVNPNFKIKWNNVGKRSKSNYA